MKIEFNKVTRFSQIIAIVLFILVFLWGIYLGMRIERNNIETGSAVIVH